jgi:hypothetical protein
VPFLGGSQVSNSRPGAPFFPLLHFPDALCVSAEAQSTAGAGPAAERSSVAVAVEAALSSEAVAAPNSALSASDVPGSSSAGCTTAMEERLRSAWGSSLAAVVGSHPEAGSTSGPPAVSHSVSQLGAMNCHPTGKCYQDPGAVPAQGKCRSKLRAIPALCPGHWKMPADERRSGQSA